MREWHDPILPYTSSTAISSRAGSPVRNVVFTIVSHDQGFVDDPKNGNWTWFVAEVAHAAPFGGAWDDMDGTLAVNGQGPIKLCKNVMAKKEFSTHRIVWNRDGDDDKALWVKSLRPGNMILVKAKAMYPGWENWVMRMRIDVYTSCLTEANI